MSGSDQYYGNYGNVPGGQPGGVPQPPQVNMNNTNYVNRQQSGGKSGARTVLTILTIAEGVILAGLIVLAVVLVMKLHRAPEDTVSVVTVQTAEPAADPAETAEPAEEYDFSALVIDAYTEDLDASGETFHYAIPMIDWEGGDVQAVNDEIYDFYYPYIEEMRALDPGERMYGESGEISYTWTMNDGILTIIAENYLYPDASGWREPDVWNVDFRDPENPTRMSEDDVLAYFGISSDELIEKAEVALGNAFCSSYSNAFDNGMDPYDSFTQQQFSRTIAESNAAAAIPFVGEDGHLWIKGQVYSIAGGDVYPSLIDMDEYETSSYYTEFMGG